MSFTTLITILKNRSIFLIKEKAIKTGSENMFVAYKKSRNALNKLIN